LSGTLGCTINGSYAKLTSASVSNVALIEANLPWADLAAIPEIFVAARGVDLTFFAASCSAHGLPTLGRCPRQAIAVGRPGSMLRRSCLPLRRDPWSAPHDGG
jgi:hypothetical protein